VLLHEGAGPGRLPVEVKKCIRLGPVAQGRSDLLQDLLLLGAHAERGGWAGVVRSRAVGHRVPGARVTHPWYIARAGQLAALHVLT
jgi:hypothetical protein